LSPYRIYPRLLRLWVSKSLKDRAKKEKGIRIETKEREEKRSKKALERRPSRRCERNGEIV
jgi:hypothetical protein